MMQLIRTYLALPIAKLTAADAERIRGIRTVALSLVLVGLLTITYQLLIFDSTQWSNWLALVAVGGFILTGLLTLAALHENRSNFASSILIIGTSIGAIIFAFPYELNAASSLIYIVPLVMAGVILDRFGLLVTLIALSLGAALQHFLHYLNVLPIVPYVTLTNRQSVPLATVILAMLVVAGILSAIADRQRLLIARLVSESRNLRTLTEFSATITAIEDDSRLLNEAADQIRDQFGYYYVQVFLVEQQSGLIVRQALNQVGHKVRTQQRIPQSDLTSVVAEAVRTGKVQRITLTDLPERRTEFLPATQSEALFPLKIGGRVYGILDIHSVQPHPPGENDQEALQALASQLTLAIQNIQRRQSLENGDIERRRLQEQVARLARDLERFTQQQTNRAWSQYLSNRSETILGFDWADGQINDGTVLSETLLKTFRNAMPQVSIVGAEQVLSVPIVSRGQALGVLEFRVPADRPWDGRSIELARTVAQRLSLTLENIRLFEQAQTIANREYTVNQVSARLETKVSLETLVEEAQKSFAEVTGSLKTQIQFIMPRSELGTG